MVHNLDIKTFQEKIFDYTKNKEWKYEGNTPAVVDFYADWCGPCKMVAPVLEKLSADYKDQVDFYKVDTEKEQELASMFGIQSIPSMLFIPVGAEPQMSVGALPEESLKEAISNVLNVEVPA